MTQDISALVGSRICHDLISPLGAIGNGVELLAMSGIQHSAEMTLIAESVENANARIRLFRVAFGAAGTDQQMGASEVTSILKAVARGGRMNFDWQVVDDPLRAEVQCAFLALLCMESAMPAGGLITITKTDNHWNLHGKTEVMRQDSSLWAALEQQDDTQKVSSSQVQFLLLPRAVQTLGRSVTTQTDPDGITIRF